MAQHRASYWSGLNLGTKTVVKANYGRYNGGIGKRFSGIYNNNGTITVKFRWHDLNGNGDYTPER